jgi:stalled ribosome alternative rescue factor ArfA
LKIKDHLALNLFLKKKGSLSSKDKDVNTDIFALMLQITWLNAFIIICNKTRAGVHDRFTRSIVTATLFREREEHYIH